MIFIFIYAKIKSMSDVKFEEEQYLVVPQQSSAPSGLASIFIKWGFTKNEKEADMMMLIIVVISIILIVLILFFIGPENTLENVIPKEKYVDPPKPWMR